MNVDPQPNPAPTPIAPAQAPIEVDTGELHSRPEVDYGENPGGAPIEPSPEIPNQPDTEPAGPEVVPQ